jgi:hypothetical protein
MKLAAAPRPGSNNEPTGALAAQLFQRTPTEERFVGWASSWRLLGEAVQLQFRRGNTENLAKRRSAKMLAFGWLVVLLGMLAIQFADGRFPFAASL